MSISKRVEDEMNREDYREPCYGDEIEDWPSQQELEADANNEQ